MSWKRNVRAILGAVALSSMGVAGCASAPETRPSQQLLVNQAEVVLTSMRAENPDLDQLIQQSAGYIVFPRVGKGGLLVGGAAGTGVLYERGEPAGFVELNQASIGAQLGGQTFSEVVVFENPADVQKVKGGEFSLGATASAVVLRAGAARSLGFQDGMAVIIKPRGGLMLDLSVAGQQLNFKERQPPQG